MPRLREAFASADGTCISLPDAIGARAESDDIQQFSANLQRQVDFRTRLR
jgi:hypothetical protein